MTKPRIIILMHYLELGGAEMSLIGLLHAFDPKKVDVDLFIYEHRGPLMEHIPDWVNLLPETKAYSAIERPMRDAIRMGQFGIAATRILSKWKHSRKNTVDNYGEDISIYSYLGHYVNKILPKINPDVQYDLCISYLIPHQYALSKVRARKKIAWIHTDYSTVRVNQNIELPVWKAYDKIVSISSDVTGSFLNCFPSLSSKILQFENILPQNYIKSQAKKIDMTDTLSGDIKLLSIGRYCNAKNYDNVPDIARRMIENGLAGLKWYIIGYGGQEALILDKIRESNMEDHVILLGKKDNPYPYIKACDIYVQPSRYEGKSITVREAQILCKPVAITNYQTAHSQINHGVDGVIVPMDNEGCAEGLTAFIRNGELQKKVVSYLSIHDYSNTSEIEKIYQLITE